jgi:hypothetical protein
LEGALAFLVRGVGKMMTLLGIRGDRKIGMRCTFSGRNCNIGAIDTMTVRNRRIMAGDNDIDLQVSDLVEWDGETYKILKEK